MFEKIIESFTDADNLLGEQIERAEREIDKTNVVANNLQKSFVSYEITNNTRIFKLVDGVPYILTLQSGSSSEIWIMYCSSGSAKISKLASNNFTQATVTSSGLDVTMTPSSWLCYSLFSLANQTNKTVVTNSSGTPIN